MAQIGWFYWVKEERGQWMPTVECISCLGGTPSSEAVALPPPPPAPGKHTVTQHGLQLSRIIELLKVACHSSTCDLQICLMQRAILPPGREAGGEASGSGTARSSRPTGHSDLGPTHQASDRGQQGLPFHPSSSPGVG